MAIKRCLLLVLFFLSCAYAQERNPLAVFEQIPKLSAALAQSGSVDMAIRIFEKFEQEYPLQSYYQVNFLLDQLRLVAVDKFGISKPVLAWKAALQIEDSKIRWQQLEKLSQSKQPEITLQPIAQVLLDLTTQIPKQKTLWQQQYADFLYFTDSPAAAAAYVNQVSWTEKEQIKTPLLLAHIYAAQGATPRAVTLLSEWVRKGNADQYVKDKLALFYASLTDKKMGYPAYEALLMQNLRNDKAKDTAKYAVHYPAPNFTLKNMKGEDVSLADLKGKVVVLDFWATWCKPCLATFPAMQKVVDRYCADPNVVFLFINTMERKGGESDRKEQIQNLLDTQKLSFEVLLDRSAEKGYSTASGYGITAIPAQFVVDPQGVVRFRLGGFNGEVDAMVEELSMLIEQLRANNI